MCDDGTDSKYWTPRYLAYNNECDDYQPEKLPYRYDGLCVRIDGKSVTLPYNYYSITPKTKYECSYMCSKDKKCTGFSYKTPREKAALTQSSFPLKGDKGDCIIYTTSDDLKNDKEWGHNLTLRGNMDRGELKYSLGGNNAKKKINSVAPAVGIWNLDNADKNKIEHVGGYMCLKKGR